MEILHTIYDDQWQCSRCTYIQSTNITICAMCNYAPSNLSHNVLLSQYSRNEQVMIESILKDVNSNIENQWQCSECYLLESLNTTDCSRCKSPQYPKCVFGHNKRCSVCKNIISKDEILWEFKHKSHCDNCHEIFIKSNYEYQQYHHNRRCIAPKCAHLQRFRTVMRKYKHNTNNLIINIKIEHILNDYLHLITAHDDDKQFESIVHYLGDCDIKMCTCFIRNSRNRNNIIMDNDEKLDAQEIVGRHIMDKMHCYFHHSYDIGYRLTSKQKVDINALDEEKTTNDPYLVDIKFNKMKQTLLSQRRKYNSNIINRINHKYNNNELISDMNQVHNCTIYHSGIQFIYGYKYEHKPSTKVSTYDRLTQTDIDFDESKAIIVSPKYKDIKEELTSNNMIRICIMQYENEYKKALYHFDSYHRRQHYMKMNIEHVLSLMIYCNFDHLQCFFSKTYRTGNGQQHSCFYHLGKNLKISVHCHNEKQSECGCCGVQNVYYHGINETLTFATYGVEQLDGNIRNYRAGVYIHGPLSTSSSYTVAANFASMGTSGLIISFKDNDSKHLRYSPKPLSVAWLSDFTYEKEHLYVQNMYKLQMDNIIEMESGYHYKYILNVLKYISGFASNYDHDYNPKIVNKLSDAIISHQLSYKFNKYKALNGLSGYGKQLCNAYFSKMKQISLKYLEWEHLDFWTQNPLYPNIKWINLDLLMQLFPNLKKAVICLQTLDKSTLDYFLSFLKRSNQDLKLCIRIPSSYGYKEMIKRYSVLFGNINYFMYDTGYIDPISRQRTSTFNIFMESSIFNTDSFTLFLMDHMDIANYNDNEHKCRLLMRGWIETKITNNIGLMNGLNSLQQQKFNEHTDNKLMLIINYKKMMNDALFTAFRAFQSCKQYCLDHNRIKSVYPNLKCLKITMIYLSQDVLTHYSDYLLSHDILCEIVLMDASSSSIVNSQFQTDFRTKYPELDCKYCGPTYERILCIEKKANQPDGYLNSFSARTWGVADCGPTPVSPYI